ncbi:MAG TPA: phospholipase D family protein [Steroidobacteraceae bacterium]|jgi:phosphatidylserine/phosphatidylglycerophosphate/cardiolipin synthase-like enzyme|nr:phospholipase D family protein [Steroidobacteraceae bacterium]
MRNTLLPVAAALLVLTGCAGLPRHVQKTPSTAFQHPETTTLGRIVAEDETGRNLSGIRILSTGEEAFASLITLADHAERTLDIQYYIIHEDESTRTLLHHVRLAADRGVRVRVLVDDLNTAGEDRRFMHLSSHANIEVRVFNPFTAGRFSNWTRFIASATDIRRINHRMHNKLFVADNALAITGGRNLGDAYFTLDPRSNFIDLDVVAAGPIVPALSASFDEFWNSKYAIPIATVASSVEAETNSAPPVEAEISASGNWLEHEVEAHKLKLLWVPATVLADQPAKIASEAAPDVEVTIANDISTLMSTADQELIIISPYFVPGTEGVALIRQLISRGVRVRILTNSLASTDSPLVDIGYARYRVPLLKLGVDLREMRPKLGQKRARFHPFRSSNASLHAKALVIDQKIVFIGSLNMDERSARNNSELGLIISSVEIAHEVTGLLDDISTDGSYKLQLDQHGRVEWVSGDAGSQKIWHTDPGTSRTERLWLKLLSPFAPDDLL